VSPTVEANANVGIEKTRIAATEYLKSSGTTSPGSEAGFGRCKNGRNIHEQ